MVAEYQIGDNRPTLKKDDSTLRSEINGPVTSNKFLKIYAITTFCSEFFFVWNVTIMGSIFILFLLTPFPSNLYDRYIISPNTKLIYEREIDVSFGGFHLPIGFSLPPENRYLFDGNEIILTTIKELNEKEER